MAAWTVETIDSVGQVGEYASLVLDSTGLPHVVCYDRTNSALVYYVRSAVPPDAGTWSKTTIDDVGDVGRWACLAIDASDTLHAATYRTTVNQLYYYSKASGGAWSARSTVAGATAVGRIAINPATALPAISYYSATSPRYAEYNGATWDATTQGAGTATATRIAFESNGDCHAIWGESTGLRYNKRTSGVWGTEAGITDSDGTVYETSIALYVAGQPWLVYSDADDVLYLHKHNGTAWQNRDTIDAAGGRFCSMAIGADGMPRIAYHVTSTILKFAKYNGSGWDTETVYSLPGTIVGQWASLALDSNLGRIAFHDPDNDDVLFAFEDTAPPMSPLWGQVGVGYHLRGVRKAPTV